jgi:hypothetical protein
MKRLNESILIILIISIPAGYTLWDMRQAKHMAAADLGLPGFPPSKK